MDLVLVAPDGTCTLPNGVVPGPYDVEVHNGVVTLFPLIRATNSERAAPPITSPPQSDRVRGDSTGARDYKGRSWSRVPAGTRMTGPAGIGTVTMGRGGELSNGRTPNQHLTDNGITANAWQVFRIGDGRTVGTAYDMNEWP